MTKVNHATEWLGPTMDWTIERYQAMIEAIVFEEDERFELLYGKIIPISPIGRFHAACVTKISLLLFEKFGREYTLRQEQPIQLADNSQPEPDYVIATYREDTYVTGHPGSEDIKLIIEVADRTLQRDQFLKKALYAENNLPEYWVINLLERQLEIHLNPEDGDYVNTIIHKEGSSFEHHLLGEVDLKMILP